MTSSSRIFSPRCTAWPSLAVTLATNVGNSAWGINGSIGSTFPLLVMVSLMFCRVTLTIDTVGGCRRRAITATSSTATAASSTTKTRFRLPVSAMQRPRHPECGIPPEEPNCNRRFQDLPMQTGPFCFRFRNLPRCYTARGRMPVVFVVASDWTLRSTSARSFASCVSKRWGWRPPRM